MNSVRVFVCGDSGVFDVLVCWYVDDVFGCIEFIG